MKVKLTTLCENTAAAPGIVAEWGWSIFIQANGMNILFDTGGGFAAAANADLLGVDLRKIDKIVLSHAHGDHTGGLRNILKRTESKEVIAHPAVWISKYRKEDKDKTPTYRGIPFAREELERYATFTLSRKPVQISENIMTTGEIPRRTDFEAIESTFLVKDGNSFKQDDFPDDLALVLNTKKGLVVILGCAHRGIINTILHAQEITEEKKVQAVIGGTHLFPKKPQQVEQTIQALKEIGVQNIGVSHCTGFDAAVKLKTAFGDRFFLNNAGSLRTIE
ncbi:MAG: MBL fold metallo-hydrolase [Deltaproteobacteria bacterium]|nr:MBL fold metallo-hydrolase [Deltaproteobacteria bacterium]MBW1961912.1 MBL fold metallo-hydrolase [Deltaproteobacteria bacterium]MBW2153656.1 MBL fold metallo-hydrolase [Deltaproteobacteria bacterium]